MAAATNGRAFGRRGTDRRFETNTGCSGQSPADDAAGTTFIGYSPRGLQLRVAYFEGATLLPPVELPKKAAAPMRRRAPAH